MQHFEPRPFYLVVRASVKDIQCILLFNIAFYKNVKRNKVTRAIVERAGAVEQMLILMTQERFTGVREKNVRGGGGTKDKEGDDSP